MLEAYNTAGEDRKPAGERNADSRECSDERLQAAAVVGDSSGESATTAGKSSERERRKKQQKKEPAGIL